MTISAWFGSFEVDPERLRQDVGRHELGERRARELLLEVLVRLLVVLEVDLLDVRARAWSPVELAP